MPVDDLWHLSRPPEDAQPCGEHGKLVASSRHGRGKRYRVRYVDPGGMPRTEHFEKKGDAERFDLKVRSDVARGDFLDPTSRRITFREYAEQWRAVQRHRPSTAYNTKSRLEHHIYPAIGDRPLAAIRHSELQAFVKGLPLAASSVRPVWGTLRAIFRAAMVDRMITHDPGLGVKLPELPHKRVVPLVLEQIEVLVEAVPARYRALLAMDAGTGLRQGEAFGVLARDDEGAVVDFLRRTIRVARQLQLKQPSNEIVLCALKNRASYRTVPLGAVVVDVLSRHIADFPPVDYEILDESDPSRPVRRKVKLIFTDHNGRPLHRRVFDQEVWKPACRRAAKAMREKAAKEADRGERDRLRALAAGVLAATMHDLRHWYASALIHAGLNVKIVAERLGHANAAMTLKVYAHLFPDDEDRSRQAIDEAFGRPTVTQDQVRSVP